MKNFNLVFLLKKYSVLILTVLFVFSLVLNFSFQYGNSKSRDLANVVSSSSDNNLDQYILKSLSSSDEDMEVIFSKKPNQEDKFIFETLVGNYDVNKNKGKISSIRLKSGNKALKSDMLATLLAEYRKTLNIPKANFEIQDQKSNSSAGTYKYNIKNNESILGQMTVEINSDQEIVSVLTVFN